MNTKGQIGLINAVGVIALIVIWILLSPFFSEFIQDVTGGTDLGSATNFFIKIFPWVGLIFMIIILVRKIQGYGERQ